MTKPTFDMTISLGNMLSIGSIVVGLSIGYSTLRADSLETRRMIVAIDAASLQRESRLRAATLAGFAMGAGAKAGNLRWHGGAVDFTWIAADNSLTTMDAQTCFAFGNAAATNESAHIFAGHAIKAMDPIPADFTNDKYWP